MAQLSLILEQKIPLPESFDASSFFEKLNEYLEIMHKNDLYHRDLAPGNVMIDFQTGEPVIIDFGQATSHVAFDEDDPTDDPYVKKIYIMNEGMTYRKMDSDEYAVSKWKGSLEGYAS